MKFLIEADSEVIPYLSKMRDTILPNAKDNLLKKKNKELHSLYFNYEIKEEDLYEITFLPPATFKYFGIAGLLGLFPLIYFNVTFFLPILLDMIFLLSFLFYIPRFIFGFIRKGLRKQGYKGEIEYVPSRTTPIPSTEIQ